jgi:acylphosphatase
VRVARRFVVRGRVQRVGFRYFVLEAATREGLHGEVRNLPDGSVDVAAEGEAESMERFERKLREGPRASRVDAVAVTELDPDGHDTGFSIR